MLSGRGPLQPASRSALQPTLTPCMPGAHALQRGREGAAADEAADALLQARDAHDLHEVALNGAQALGVAQAAVQRVLALRDAARARQGRRDRGPARAVGRSCCYYHPF